MTRKAQITTFILIGIIIIISFFLVFYISKNRNENAEVEKSTKMSFETGPIQEYIGTCLKNVAIDGIFFISSRGGYYDLPYDYFKARPVTSFYVKNSLDVSPSLEYVEKELSKYMRDQLEFCIDKGIFEGRTIEFDENEVNVIIDSAGIISINLNMPTKIISGSSIFVLSNFHSTINDVKLAKSFDVAKNITHEIVKNPKYLPLTFIYNSAESNNLKVVIDSYNDSTFVFQMLDKTDLDSRYRYNFAVHVSLENEN